MQFTEEIKNDLADKINSLVQANDLTEQQQLIKFLDYLYIQRKSRFFSIEKRLYKEYTVNETEHI